MTSSQGSRSKSRKIYLDLDSEIKNSVNDFKITDLEQRSQDSSYDAHSSLRSSSYYDRKNSSMMDEFLKTVTQTEKKIESMEKSIRRTPKIRKHPETSQLLKDLQAQLIQERQQNYAMRLENEKLRRKVQYKKNCRNDLVNLQEDYRSLIDSFKRSENIRKKQKGLITSLKSQVLSKSKYI